MTKTAKKELCLSNERWRTLLNRASDKQLSLSFLEDFFKSKDADLDSATLRSNAESIVKLFPYYSVDYIAERLQVLGNEQNSVAVVLRQLLAKQGKTKASRQANLKNLEKYCTEEAYAKTDNGASCYNNNFAELDLLFSNESQEDGVNKLVTTTLDARKHAENNPEDRPSTSKDCTLNKPCTQTSNSNLDILCEFASRFETNEIWDSTKFEQNLDEVQTDSTNIKISTFAGSAVQEAEGEKQSTKTVIVDSLKETIEEVIKINSDDDYAGNRAPFTAAAFDLSRAKNQDCFQKTQSDVNNGVFRPWDLKLKHGNKVATLAGETPSNNVGKPGNINLIAYLKELFPGKSERDIYVSCLRNSVDLNHVPRDSAFDVLIRDLGSDEPSGVSTKRGEQLEEIKGGDQLEEIKEEAILLDVNEEKGGDNEEGNKEAEPPAPKRVKTVEGDNASSDFRFCIVNVNEGHERRLVHIPHADQMLSYSDDWNEVETDEMDASTDEEDEEAVLFPHHPQPDAPQTSYDNKLLSKLAEIFPDACPMYIRRLSTGKTYSHEVIDEITNHIFSIADYPKRRPKSPSPEPDLDPERQLNILKEILPDADPTYLQYHVELYMNDQDKLKNFISTAIEKHNYPTMKEYLRKQQLSAQEKQYTTEFNVEKFLEVIPDPEAYFGDSQRKSSINTTAGDMTFLYAFKFLKNMYSSLPIRLISSIFEGHNYNLFQTKKHLDKFLQSGVNLMKSRRKRMSITDTIQNIPLLQEIAYLEHQEEIAEYIKTKEERAAKEKEKAREAGYLQTCNCCYDEEVMPASIMTCENGCAFCKTCIQRSAEIAFGENKLDFPCLGDCNSHFSLQTLQLVLSPKLFSKMAQKKQLEEVKAAGIEDLETCPFCDFATIPAPGDKLFKCYNSECMKESCRECKEPSHIPLRCDEIEKDDDVKRRVYIENKMTEALLRKCYNCGLKFIKSDGCNKMTCSCGASMCYICGQAVQNYSHFNGQGGDKYHLCPLYSDTTQLHQEEVLRGAEEAKQEVGVSKDPSKLKIDPTADLEKYYQKEKRKNPYQLPPGMHAGNAPPMRPQVGPDDIYFHVGVRVNHNNVQFNHVHRRHHHHHVHPPHRRRPHFL